MSQTTVQRPEAVRFGSALFELGETLGSLVNIGALRNCQVAESWEEVKVESGNAGVLKKKIKNQKVAITADWLEWDLETANLLRGGIDEYDTVPGTPTPVTDEEVKLEGTNLVRLEHKNGDNTEVTTIVVTSNDATPVARTLNTDYVIGVDPAGYTCIARIEGGAIIDGDTVLVDYSYTPNVSKKLTSGGKFTINPRVVKLTNKNEAGKDLTITIYYAMVGEGFTLPFPDDTADDAMVAGVNLVGEIDASRAAGDQLYEILDEQSVT